MKKKMISRLMATAVMAAVTLGTLAGCGSAQAKEKGKRTVVFQTADSYAPTAYLDDEGKPAGYEVEVIKAVAELLPQYDFVIEAVPNDGLDNNLLSGKADVLGFKMTKDVSETENFTAGNEQYDTIVERIFILAENEDLYHDISDFAGKTVYAFPSEKAKKSHILNIYNEEHPDNQVNIEYISDPATCVNDLVTGKTDGFTRSQPSVISYSERFGVKLTTAKVGATHIDGIFYKYRKDEDPQLIADIDGALKTLKENGTINEIHERLFYGTDWDFEGDITEWVAEHPEYLKESEY